MDEINVQTGFYPYDPDKPLFVSWDFGKTDDTAIVIPFDDARNPSGSYWPTREDEAKCWNLVRSVLGDRSIPKLFQNGAYDISFYLHTTLPPSSGNGTTARR